MSKRSKVMLVILVSLILVILLSFLNEESATDSKLDKWEEEIVDPNNQLDPLNEKVGENVFIISVAQKIEGMINKVFSFVISFFEGVIDRVFVSI